MKEIVLNRKKNGMAVMLLTILLWLVSIAGVVFGGMMMDAGVGIVGLPVFIISMIWMCLGWIPLLGLKVVGPQEALVLTLFGKYVGTLKGDGFFFVNPFCTAVNPAAKTKLNQSGDVDSGAKRTAVTVNGQPVETVNKKISLKAMTLNNSRQKINDCLGNPVEIG
ncbi:MAG: SPFH domain-containing protein, partial [Clostridia bacterium]|nr:SPFH domain-containing protein [Clostridia bacterium]